jgi:hypothetical protein
MPLAGVAGFTVAASVRPGVRAGLIGVVAAVPWNASPEDLRTWAQPLQRRRAAHDHLVRYEHIRIVMGRQDDHQL